MTCNFVTVMCSYANLWVEASPRKCPLTRLCWSVSSARCLMSITSCETVTEECDGVCSIGLFYWKTSLGQKRGSFPAVPLTMVCRWADFVIGETCDLRLCTRTLLHLYLLSRTFSSLQWNSCDWNDEEVPLQRSAVDLLVGAALRHEQPSTEALGFSSSYLPAATGR